MLAPLLGGGALTFLIERLLQPAPLLAGRSSQAFAAHLGIWTLAFAALFGLTQRPWFAALLGLAELLFLSLVSNAKVAALREPFVFADIEYFTDTLKHPRLFLPYLGVARSLVAASLFGLALYLGFVLESGFPARTGYSMFLMLVAGLLGISGVLLWLGTPRPLRLSFDAAADLRRHGLLAHIWYYAWAERGAVVKTEKSRYALRRAAPSSDRLPHIVVVQSESFFDARRLYPQIQPSLLAQFDATRRAALQHGLVQVPAWGGNTARTEFAFLSGLTASELGVHRFNPHRRVARRGPPNLAQFLKGAGYRAVCMHPYPASFYSRDVVYPALGFDQFIDLKDFSGAGRYGPYISDEAVAERACALLATATQPLLLFLITMENHGPLHLENVVPGDVERLYTAPPPPGFDDLTVYLRHIVNADRMVSALTTHLSQGSREALLCWYGDHVPILPRVYQATGFPDGSTDYFIWGTVRSAPVAERIDLPVEDLGVRLLEYAGLPVLP